VKITMRTILMINGPLPPEGKEFCPICVGLMRNDLDHFFRKAIETGLRENTQSPLILDVRKAHHDDPQFAEVVAISIMPQLGLLRVCWGHVLAAQLSSLPPAIQGQMQGVPSLGGR
jgi:hypothetical protein